MKTVVIVPSRLYISQNCELSLRKLEDLGYTVWRCFGFSAIDQGRNVLATTALREGFDEIIWIDDDIGFNPDDVKLLQSGNLPIIGGVYPKKGQRSLAVELLPGIDEFIFGVNGRIEKIKYCGSGFLYVNMQVYRDLVNKLKLPLTNQRYNDGNWQYPFYLPMIHDGNYLCEDYAFLQRCSEIGYSIFVNTKIRLSHVGMYGYQWEDAGHRMPRSDDFRFKFIESI